MLVLTDVLLKLELDGKLYISLIGAMVHAFAYISLLQCEITWRDQHNMPSGSPCIDDAEKQGLGARTSSALLVLAAFFKASAEVRRTSCMLQLQRHAGAVTCRLYDEPLLQTQFSPGN